MGAGSGEESSWEAAGSGPDVIAAGSTFADWGDASSEGTGVADAERAGAKPADAKPVAAGCTLFTLPDAGTAGLSVCFAGDGGGTAPWRCSARSSAVRG